MPQPVAFDPRDVARLNGLHLRAKRLVEGYVAGLHRSPFRGRSIEFAEHRAYVPGDDIRHVDWKLLSRTDKHYLKRFDDDTNLVCRLAVDASESMSYRGPGAALSKWEYAQALASLLAFVVIRGQDAVSLSVFVDDATVVQEPSSRPTAWKRIVDSLFAAAPAGKSDLATACDQLARRAEHRSVVVLIGDFLAPADQVATAMRPLAIGRHDVVALHLLDPSECEFPFEGEAEFVALEDAGVHRVDPSRLRDRYLAEHAAWRADLERRLSRQEIEYFAIRTDEPFDKALRRFLGRRAARVS